MAQHSAVVMTAPHAPLVVREFPSPKLEPGAALLRTLYSEVCGTDVHLHHGKLNVPFDLPCRRQSVSEETGSLARTSVRIPLDDVDRYRHHRTKKLIT